MDKPLNLYQHVDITTNTMGGKLLFLRSFGKLHKIQWGRSKINQSNENSMSRAGQVKRMKQVNIKKMPETDTDMCPLSYQRWNLVPRM